MEIIAQEVEIGSVYFWTEYSKNGEEFTENIRLQDGVVGIFLEDDMSVLEWITVDSIGEFVVNCCHWSQVARFVYVGNSEPVQVALREIDLLNDMRGY